MDFDFWIIDIADLSGKLSAIFFQFQFSIQTCFDETIFFSDYLRIFWMCTIFTSLAGMITIFLYAINSFENNEITININTHFLHWKNTFPAVSFCMLKPFNLKGEQKIKSFMRNYYADHKMDDLSE